LSIAFSFADRRIQLTSSSVTNRLWIEMDRAIEEQRTERIRALNDRLRREGAGGRTCCTSGVAALDFPMFIAAIEAVRGFTDFDANNDPWGEHDCGLVTVQNRRFIWKIDYYDRAMAAGSEDSSDPENTCRVLTIMLASEY
jgi:hypothetical protein